MHSTIFLNNFVNYLFIMVCWCDILPGVHSFACHWYINDKFSLNSLNEWLKFKMDGINKRATMGKGGGRSPLPFFENLKKCPDFGKKGPNCVHPWVESSIQNVILRVSRRKSSKTFPCGAIFLCFWRKVYRSVLIPQNLPCPEKFLVARLHLNGLVLVDLSKNSVKKLDMPIGLDYYYTSITGESRGKQSEPIALKSIFGWIICGYFKNINITHMYRVNTNVLIIIRTV